MMGEEMTGRERFIKLLKKESIDRIPVAPFIHNNFINEFFRSNEVDPVEKGIEVYKYFGFDIMLRTCSIGSYLDERACASENWIVHEEKNYTGSDCLVSTTIKTPEKELRQIKSVKKVTEYESIEAIVEYYIKNENDFEQFLKYQSLVPEYDCSIIKRAKETLGEDGIIAPWAQGAFNIVSFYRKIDDLILDPYIAPEFYDKMMRYFSDRMLQAISQFKNAGADVISCGGNVGNSSMVGPVFFKDHVLPYEMDFAKKVKKTGIFYLYHNCGDAAKILKYYSLIDMDIYESLAPPPYGDTDLKEAIDVFDKDIILSGNIDQIHFLKYASETQIYEEVERIIQLAKKRGRFILSTTDYFSEGTPYKNIMALSKAGLKFGRDIF